MSGQQLVHVPNGVAGLARQIYSEADIKLLKNHICKGATDEQIDLLVNLARIRGLDLFAKQIHGIVRKIWNSETKTKEPVMTTVVGIDGFRLQAQRSGEYQGQTVPQWCGRDLVWLEVWQGPEAPVAARIGVWRKNFREPLYAVCSFRSYAQEFENQNTKKKELAGLWATKPDVMLAKCAEALALRKAFPQELSGLYSEEEVEIIGEVVDEPENPKPATGTDKKARDYKTIVTGTPKPTGRTASPAPPKEDIQEAEVISEAPAESPELVRLRNETWLAAQNLWNEDAPNALLEYTKGASLRSATLDQCKTWLREINLMMDDAQIQMEGV
jgi:phage recombination protein Bet